MSWSALADAPLVEVVDALTGAVDEVFADDLQVPAGRRGVVPVGEPPPVEDEDGGEQVAGAPVDPVELAAAALRQVDRSMAAVLRAVATGGSSQGLSVRRRLGLWAGATGAEVGFVDRAVQVLGAMPRVWAAFDAGGLSWSQLRGIVVEARRLSVAQRELLDGLLADLAVAGRDTGEPDRIVEVTADLVARIDREGQETIEAAQDRAQRLVVQPGLDGWAEIHGCLGPEVAATVAEALDAAADPPVGDGPVTDDDGRALPARVRPAGGRAGQWAEALGRVCASFLGGSGTCTCGAEHDRAAHDEAQPITAEPDTGGPDTAEPGTAEPDTAEPDTAEPDTAEPDVAGEEDGEPVGPAGAASTATRHVPGCGAVRRARPRVLVIAPLADLLDDGADGVGGVTARLLWRRGTGRRRISRALVRHLADDADMVPVFTDDAGMPVAIGDSFDPIGPALRRAVIARDQGCRAPGCSAPAAHCDVHHIIPRHLGGATSIGNLAMHCRPDHTAVVRHGWVQRMDPDGTLHTTIGRRTYVTRPRLTDLTVPPGGRPVG
jgi:hypothetical protein